MKHYTGIGSRETPLGVLTTMEEIARRMAEDGWTLRSGGAKGADTAFESGCLLGNKEIYLPWKGFNGSQSALYETPQEAYEIAATLHPAWKFLRKYAKDFHARNVLQVLGQDLNTPSDVLICWTKNGQEVGGTATAIKLAKLKQIPIFNLAIVTAEEFRARKL